MYIVYMVYTAECVVHSNMNDTYIGNICCIFCIIVTPAVIVDIVITIECQFRLNLGLFRVS